MSALEIEARVRGVLRMLEFVEIELTELSLTSLTVGIRDINASLCAELGITSAKDILPDDDDAYLSDVELSKLN